MACSTIAGAKKLPIAMRPQINNSPPNRPKGAGMYGTVLLYVGIERKERGNIGHLTQFTREVMLSHCHRSITTGARMGNLTGCGKMAS
jgi:hypothetical protein